MERIRQQKETVKTAAAGIGSTEPIKSTYLIDESDFISCYPKPESRNASSVS